MNAKTITTYESRKEHSTAEHARPFVTVDDVIISNSLGRFSVILIQRRNEPFSGCWTLPGGFILENESPYHAAKRKLKSETNLSDVPLSLIGVFGNPGRDPRGWVISMAYCAVVDSNYVKPLAGDDAAGAAWFILDWQLEKDVLSISLEHNQVKLRAKLRQRWEETMLGPNVYFNLLENKGLAFDHANILATAISFLEHIHET